MMTDTLIKSNITINIGIPDKNVERNVEWNLNETVESLKSYLLKIVPGLDDPLNYGIFLPPSNGRNGKFLQEERILNHYSQSNCWKLELKKKVRLYHLTTNSPKLKKINNKSNQKQLVQCIRNSDVMKINKFLYDGVDPNFHVPGIPETPLSLACKLKDPHVIIMALANNGAHLDFRSTDSLTALHKTAIEGLYEPMKTLLQLGQSPNCKDIQGYTPLYHCIERDAPAECVQLLLFEHSIIGVSDEHGHQEVHKACLYGRTQHLDHLLSYGADIDAKTKKGNTALHICALHNQGACARLLLYRGILRHAVNDENKSAYQTALLSNNLELADLIQTFRDDDVVPVTTLPKFNEKRRSIILSMKRFPSLGRLSCQTDDLNRDNNVTSSDERISFYGSVKSLPQSTISSPNTPQRHSNLTEKILDTTDCQSLQNFSSAKTRDNIPHLNTWTSADVGTKATIKTRPPIASILNSKMENIPRVIVLQKSSAGFGFIIRGSKNDSQVEFVAKPSMPATHYFEGIAENSPSERAGLLSGDFLLEVNNIDVHKMTHGEVVRIIQMAGDNLTMKVITVNPASASSGLFDGYSDAKSCSDSTSMMSDNSISLSASPYNCVIEGTSDSKNSISKGNQIPRQNMTALLPAECKEDDFIKSKLKAHSQNTKRNNNFNDNSRVVKAPAPPPPIRADNTLVFMSQSSNDNTSRYSNENRIKNDYNVSDATVTPNELSSAKYITQPQSISTNSSKSSSKIFIPPADYSSDTEDDIHRGISNGNTNNIAPKINSMSILLCPLPPPPPPPAPVTSMTGPVLCQSPASMHHQNLDKAISSISLKPVIHNDKDVFNDESNSNISSHDKALRDAILNHRKKVECGESISVDIDEKLKETKVGNKSIVFEANLSPIQTNDATLNSSTTSPNLIKNDFYKKVAPAIPTKNPSLKPKSVPQNFFTAGNIKQSPIVETTAYNVDGENCKLKEPNLRTKAEKLRTDLVKQEQETKKGSLYFTSTK